MINSYNPHQKDPFFFFFQYGFWLEPENFMMAGQVEDKLCRVGGQVEDKRRGVEDKLCRVGGWRRTRGVVEDKRCRVGEWRTSAVG